MIVLLPMVYQSVLREPVSGRGFRHVLYVSQAILSRIIVVSKYKLHVEVYEMLFPIIHSLLSIRLLEYAAHD